MTPNGTERSAPRSKSSFCTRVSTSRSVVGKVRGEGEPDVRVQLVDRPERCDPAVELRHARPVSEARLAAVPPARVDPGQADGLIPFPRHRHRLGGVEIRRASDDEIEPLTRLFIRARNEMDYLPRVPDEAAVPIAARIREHEEVWVAEEDGRLLGFLGIEHSTNLDAPVLEKIYVDPAEQNRGVGSALLDKAKELRPAELYLWVFQKNPARRLYERNGFMLMKLTDGADNMEREPDALYRWNGSV